MREMDSYSLEMLHSVIRGLKKISSTTVLHRKTCPKCGRSLVNLYKHGEAWKCRRCIEEEAET